MKFSTSAAVFAAALGVSAHPSGHNHKHIHRSVEARAEFVKAIKPVTVYETKTVIATAPAAAPTYEAPPPPAPKPVAPKPKPQPAPKPKPAPAPAPAPKPDPPKVPAPKPSDGGSAGSGQGPSKYTPFCGGAPTKRATTAEIAYKGNVGAAGNYGCNFMLIQSNIYKQYDYVVELTNGGNKKQDCVAYNKIGPDNGINGFFKGNQALSFSLPANGVQYIAVDANTQGGIICQAGSIQTSSFGEFVSTWFELDVANSSNNGWSGGDASCLAAASAGMTIPGLKACHDGTCSTIYPGGTGENAFLAGMEALDGLGLNIPAGKALFEVTVDFQG